MIAIPDKSGGVFEFKRVRAIWPSLWRLSLCEVGLTFLLTGGVCAIEQRNSQIRQSLVRNNSAYFRVRRCQ